MPDQNEDQSQLSAAAADAAGLDNQTQQANSTADVSAGNDQSVAIQGGDLPADPNGAGETEQPKEEASTDAVQEPATKTEAPQVIDQGTAAEPATAQVAVAAEAPVQTAAKPTEAAVTDVGVSVTDDSDLGKLLNKIHNEGTQQQKSLVHALKKYMEDMQPGKPMTAIQGSQHQMRLWETLRGVVENPNPEEFRRQMFIVRAFFKRHANDKTALNDHYIHRFADAWPRNPQQLSAMQRMVNIFQLTADPLTTAENLKHVDLARSLSTHFTEGIRQRVISYYQQ